MNLLISVFRKKTNGIKLGERKLFPFLSTLDLVRKPLL